MSVNWNTSFNEMYLDANRLNDAELNSFDTSTNSENGQTKLNKSAVHYDESMMMSTSVYDEKTGAASPGGTTASGDSVAGRQLTNNSNSKFNSFPMRQKKSKMMKQAPKSVSSLHADTLMKNHAANNNNNNNNNASAASQQGHHHHASRHLLVTYTEEELELNVRSARHRAQDGERLKQTIRTNCWPIRHPMRCYLWKCLLQVSGKKSNGSDLGSSGDEGGNQHAGNKENQFKVDLVANESDYNRHLDRIFGKSREIDVPLPEFVNPTMDTTHRGHLNYYFLNAKGRDAVKRVLCVYEYHYPHVTYNPLLVSVVSLLLHYMQEHEVFAALCVMSSSKDHFLESKASWETSTSVFLKLLKTYCKSSYEVISKYATDPLEEIFDQWIWWIFDSLSFDFLVKIMDCYIFEGQKILYRVSLAIVQHFSKILFFSGSLKNPIIDAKSENIKVNKDSIKNFCTLSFSFESIEKLLKTSFSIRNLKRSVIKEFFTKEEARRKQFGTTSQNGVKQQNGEAEIIPNQNSPSRIFVNEMTTSILSHAQLCTIWNWLPQRLSVYSPSMLFTTQEDGTSFNTLFNVLDNLEYSLIVVKTFNDEIFGAFCAGYWSERKENQLYFGTGETFLFTIAPEKKCFKWVGTRRESTSTSQEMFMRADSSKLTIGGGGGNGLSITSSLTEGTTGRCETFENEPLGSVPNFQISILEVIGFISMNC